MLKIYLILLKSLFPTCQDNLVLIQCTLPTGTSRLRKYIIFKQTFFVFLLEELQVELHDDSYN